MHIRDRTVRAVGRWALMLALAVVAIDANAQGWPLVACAAADNLPYSNSAEEGFENVIASMIAEELGADLDYVWVSSPFRSVYVRLLQQGECDVLMAVADGQAGFETTAAYYRSSYVFVQREDHPESVRSFDDPELGAMTIGVLSPEGGRFSPPMQALVTRGLGANQRTFVASGASSEGVEALVAAVERGEVDVAIGWGPLVSYFAAHSTSEMRVSPVEPQIDWPFVPMVGTVSAGFRAGEIELAERMSEALTRRWLEVQEVLEEYSVPLLPLPRPRLENVR